MVRSMGRVGAVVALVLILLLPGAGASATGPEAGTGGPTTAVGATGVEAAGVVTNPLSQFTGVTLAHGGYVAAGVAMRNRGYGTLTLSGIPANSHIEGAYLFWDILANTEQPEFAHGKMIAGASWFMDWLAQSKFFLGASIAGTRVGLGGDPCWGNSHNFAYRADVTQLVSATGGNGRYFLSGFASGLTNAQDPWHGGNTTPPMLEGASLVVIYSNPGSPPTSVMIYNGGFSSSGPGYPYPVGAQTLGNFGTFDTISQAQTTFIVADGQSASEPSPTFNGQSLGMSFNGHDPQDGPNYSEGNLWDTETKDVTSLISPGQTSATTTLQGGGDCLVWVAQVFSLSGHSIDAQALLAPVAKGITLTIFHGYNDPAYSLTNPQECDIATQNDHCGNQRFGLDLMPGPGWDHKILALAPGIPRGPVNGGAAGPCLNFQLAGGANLNICHFTTNGINQSLLGHAVPRGTILGTAASSWIHLSLDRRPQLCSGGWTFPKPRQFPDDLYWCPVPFTAPYTLEGQSLAPHGGTPPQWANEPVRDWQGQITFVSSNVETSPPSP